jgi:hypothetical protein
MRLDGPLPECGWRGVELTCRLQLSGLPFQPAPVADPGCLRDYCLKPKLLVLVCRQHGNASPAHLPEGFRHFVTSMPAPVASGWSVRRVGLAPTGKRRLFTAHTQNGHPSAEMESRIDAMQDYPIDTR